MRFGGVNGPPVFPFLPDSLPKELYCTVAPVKKKPVVHKVQDNQPKLIRAIAKHVVPELWVDSNIFPVSEEVLRCLSMLDEKQASTMTAKTTRYVSLQVGGSVKILLAASGQVVVDGSAGEVFAYAAKYCPAAMRSLVQSMRMNYITVDKKFLDLATALSWYRKQREFSRGLDVVSKQDELGWIDQEHVVNKFIMEEEEPMNERCLHLGAGLNISSSQLAFSHLYQRVVLVDPRCVAGQDSIAEVFDINKVEPGWDIVSDIACGDAEGMTLDGQKKLIEDLYSISLDRLVIVKIGLQKGVNARAVVRRKPRPHNLEIILQLHPEGDSIDEIYDEFAPQVLSANEERNKRMFQHKFGVKKKTFNDPWTLAYIIKRDAGSILPKAKYHWAGGVNRNNVLYQCAGGRIRSRRYKEFAGACQGDGAADGPYCILPDTFHLGRGVIKNYDPGLPCPHFSFRSVLKTAAHRGMRVQMINGQLAIV